MLEKQPSPWKLKAEELSPLLQASSSKQPPLPTQGLWLVSGFVGLLVAIGFLGWQNSVLQMDTPTPLPELRTETVALQILPAPNRYALWAQASLSKAGETLLENPSITKISAAPGFPETLINDPTPPPPVLPNNLPLNLSSLPEEPSFSLVGIAQGADGMVATIKVKAGNSEEIKDVRQGAPLLPGYTVTQIAEEYVLLKTSKGGKTIRVD